MSNATIDTGKSMRYTKHQLLHSLGGNQSKLTAMHRQRWRPGRTHTPRDARLGSVIVQLWTPSHRSRHGLPNTRDKLRSSNMLGFVSFIPLLGCLVFRLPTSTDTIC